MADLAAVVPWLRDCDPSSIRRLARRLGVRRKRGRGFLHSPDPAYDAKLAAITAAQCFARAAPGQVVLLYEDEFTYTRRPTVASGYAPIGSALPAAPLGHGPNTRRRVAACLDAATGRVLAWQRAHFDRRALRRFYETVAAAYPEAEHVFLVHDNWPVHHHPDLVDGLADPRVHLLPLPTYAPWTNPVEQLWRALKADLLHLHPFAADWDGLQAAVAAWLATWATPNIDHLHQLGLCPH